MPLSVILYSQGVWVTYSSAAAIYSQICFWTLWWRLPHILYLYLKWRPNSDSSRQASGRFLWEHTSALLLYTSILRQFYSTNGGIFLQIISLVRLLFARRHTTACIHNAFFLWCGFFLLSNIPLFALIMQSLFWRPILSAPMQAMFMVAFDDFCHIGDTAMIILRPHNFMCNNFLLTT